jgi:calcineurin-like phosphoesterase family protein/2'-5' RNA ligase
MNRGKRQAQFFVEIRLWGYAHRYTERLAYDVSRKFGVRGLTSRRVVPHIALYGESRTKEGYDIRSVERVVREVCNEFNGKLIPFKLRGFEHFPDKRTVFIDVYPSNELNNIRDRLYEALRKISYPNPKSDNEVPFAFHATIAMRDIVNKFEQIWTYIKEIEEPNINQNLLRITILTSESKIYCEYDLLLKRRLNRQQALSSYWRRKTIAKLRELQQIPEEPRVSLWNQFAGFLSNLLHKEKTYLIADTHFGHANIIEYCRRPFPNVSEMNRILTANWNGTVGKKDTVYFLGDLAMGNSPNYWLKRLNGHIQIVTGNHYNEIIKQRQYRTKVIHAGGYSFLLVHSPEQRITPWHGWIIHGHKHNNRPEEFPFINGINRTINVSVEVIDYKPVSLDYLLSLDLNSIRRMNTIHDKPERF